MLFNNKKHNAFLVAILMAFISCETIKESKPIVENKINFSHFNHLYKEIKFNGKEVGIVHIYSEYPEYEFEIEPNEGFTCVDDVARAVVMFSKHLKTNEDKEAFNKMEKLTQFVLLMQNENGYFNNFIWNDLSINTTYKTSVAELNWWSFRALWALESAYDLLKSDKDLANRIEIATEKLLVNIKRDISINNLKVETIEAIKVPTWLPQKYASDQSALLILGLLKNYERTANEEIKVLIDSLAKGIMIMQKGNVDNYPYGAFLSWQNLWHAWGNIQAYALLKAGQKFNNQIYINSALKEIDNFYPYLLKNGFAEAFWIEKNEENSYSEIKRNDYPQIAYGLRPMVWAASEAYQYSKNKKYLKLTTDLESWLSGNNDAKTVMYNPETGICFDGIKSKEEISKNSGAESTIESMLILLEIKKLKQE
ncbi:MAG: hypothetical protein DRI75_09725 [Bacteroidetes bacterium]|nr:MAG: hypothetical protein DRI75_09725 [Bacteroidota bacterium]